MRSPSTSTGQHSRKQGQRVPSFLSVAPAFPLYFISSLPLHYPRLHRPLQPCRPQTCVPWQRILPPTTPCSAPFPVYRTAKMRFGSHALVAALVPGLALAGASEPLKAVIVSYPSDTPHSVMQQAMDAIVAAVRRGVPYPMSLAILMLLLWFQKGVITHEYHIIKGFAAKAPEEALNQVRTHGVNNGVKVEDDQIVSINGRSQ